MHKTMYRRVRYLKLTCYYPAFRCCWKEFSYIVRCTFILFLTFVRSLYIVSLYVAFIIISHKFLLASLLSLNHSKLSLNARFTFRNGTKMGFVAVYHQSSVILRISTFIEKTGKLQIIWQKMIHNFVTNWSICLDTLVGGAGVKRILPNIRINVCLLLFLN